MDGRMYAFDDLVKAYRQHLDRRRRSNRLAVTLEKKDLEIMIDVALRHRQEEWFYQLMKRLDCLEVWGGKIVV